MMDVTTKLFIMCTCVSVLVMVFIKLFVKKDDDIKIHDEDSISKEDFSDELDWKVVKDIANKLQGVDDEDEQA